MQSLCSRKKWACRKINFECGTSREENVRQIKQSGIFQGLGIRNRRRLGRVQSDCRISLVTFQTTRDGSTSGVWGLGYVIKAELEGYVLFLLVLVAGMFLQFSLAGHIRTSSANAHAHCGSCGTWCRLVCVN